MPIPVTNNMTQPSQMIVDSDPAPSCPPVSLRWDPRLDSVPAGNCKLQFPLEHSESTTLRNMQQLLDDMEPATFGYQGQDILDESYRKASKLDPSRFACTFNPHELGIVDEVARILIPDVKSKTTSYLSRNSTRTEAANVVRAELYKLNVYSGPSGRFKAHVDTPRSTDQIGSLVVCLPCAHQGGQLEVRHEGQSMTFDWSMTEASPRPEIQWAVFYSDCEHEVKEVTSGHRITLTYNLYAMKSNSTSVAVRSGLLDPTRLPQYSILAALFLRKDFMLEGGYLGVHMSHAYPHTSTSACLPATLKGSDMAAWETFRSLGCGLRLRPVVELPQYSHYGHDPSVTCPAEALSVVSSSDAYSSGSLDRPEIDAEQRNSPQQNADQVLAEGSGPASMSGSEDFDIDAEEVLGLQQEIESDLFPPGTEYLSPEPDDLLYSEHEQDLDEELIANEFKQIGKKAGCRVLGNGLSLHTYQGLPIEMDDQMEYLLDKWMARRPAGPREEGTATQPDRILYEEVAWLNHSGRHKEPQIAYATVSLCLPDFHFWS